MMTHRSRHLSRLPRQPATGGSLVFVLGLLLLTALGRPAGSQSPPSLDGRTPNALPSFVPNRGQWPAEVRFRYRQGPATAWLHDDGEAAMEEGSAPAGG